MDIKKITRMLHPFEREVLPLLVKVREFSRLKDLTALKEVEVMRALEWLENKKLIHTEKIAEKVVVLDEHGREYAVKGLPERRLIEAVKSKPADSDSIKKKACLNDEEFNVAVGTLRRLNALSIEKKDKKLILSITPAGKSLLKTKTPEEQLLLKKFPLTINTLPPEEKKSLALLEMRKGILAIKEEKDRIISLTPLAKEVLKTDLGKDSIGRLTPNILRGGSWKDKEFRAYDVSINVPPVYPGKRHIVTQAVDYIRKIWLEMGFKEMEGRMIETAFWNLDALFVPQDHPARDMQSTFYLADPEYGRLPPAAKKVMEVHINGGNTGSTGWGGSWSRSEASQLLLRTQTTVLSAQTISKLKESDLPAKFFAVGKVFRNEALDFSHLFEFYQVEGIVVDPNANFKHLKGYLKEFYTKMGYSDVRIRPAYFPYTEPSCEVEVFHPVKKKWIELGGAGIFRPEVIMPLMGKDIPVLAWGLGLGRVISSYYQITDIRDLYKNDLKMLREAELWVR